MWLPNIKQQSGAIVSASFLPQGEQRGTRRRALSFSPLPFEEDQAPERSEDEPKKSDSERYPEPVFQRLCLVWLIDQRDNGKQQ